MHCVVMNSKEDSMAVAEGLRDVETQTQAGLWAQQGVQKHREPLIRFQGGPCSLCEFASFKEVTASILGIQIHSPGLGEEGRGRGGLGRLLLQSNVSGEAERTLCFVGLVFPLIPPYL